MQVIFLSVRLSTFKLVKFGVVVLEITLQLFQRFGVEQILSRKSSVRNNGNNVNGMIGCVHVTLAIHDLFFVIAVLKEMKSICEILLS